VAAAITEPSARDTPARHDREGKHVITLKELIDQHGIDVLDYLDRELAVPVLTGDQAQGDVIVFAEPGARAATDPVPQDGIAVVKGEAGGNTHLLLNGFGTVVYWRPSATAGTSTDDLDLGVLTVPEGATAWLAHPEHGYSGIGAGTYVVGRQREQAKTVQFVQD
jgi:hypothetical protein